MNVGLIRRTLVMGGTLGFGGLYREGGYVYMRTASRSFTVASII